IESFGEAIRLDPGFAPAYAWQGSAYQILGNLGELTPREVVRASWPLVTRAVELDPNSADTQASLGWSSLLYAWDFPRAERSFRRALDINPDSANAPHRL